MKLACALLLLASFSISGSLSAQNAPPAQQPGPTRTQNDDDGNGGGNGRTRTFAGVEFGVGVSLTFDRPRE